MKLDLVIPYFLSSAFHLVLLSTLVTGNNFLKKTVRQSSLDLLSGVSPGSPTLLTCIIACNFEPLCKVVEYTNAGVCKLYSGTFDNHMKEQFPNGNVSVEVHVNVDRVNMTCPPGYTIHDPLRPWSYYKLYPVAVHNFNWPQAQAACSAEGTKLAQIYDAAEKAFLTSGSTIIFGAYQRPGSDEPAGGWFWTGSEEPVDLTKFWNAIEPNDFDNVEHYGAMDASGRYNDLPLFSVGNVYCECLLM